MKWFNILKQTCKEASQDFKSLQPYLQLLIYIAVSGIIIYTMTIFGVAKFYKSISFEHIGRVGDSFGAATSFFSFLTVIGLLITISQQRDANQKQQEANELQRKELQDTRDELALTRKTHEQQSETLKLQQFENTFFHCLDSLTATIKFIGNENYLEKNKNIRSTLKKYGPNNRENIIGSLIANDADVLKLINTYTNCLYVIHKFCPDKHIESYIHILSNRLTASENGLMYYAHISDKHNYKTSSNKNIGFLYQALGVDKQRIPMLLDDESMQQWENKTTPKNTASA